MLILKWLCSLWLERFSNLKCYLLLHWKTFVKHTCYLHANIYSQLYTWRDLQPTCSHPPSCLVLLGWLLETYKKASISETLFQFNKLHKLTARKKKWRVKTPFTVTYFLSSTQCSGIAALLGWQRATIMSSPLECNKWATIVQSKHGKRL